MYVYIIEQANTGYVKIGISADVQSRLAALQTASPQPLTLRYTLACIDRPAAMTAERLLHDRYADFRQAGEWFDVPCRQVVADLDLCRAMSNLVGDGGEHVEQVVAEPVAAKVKVRPLALLAAEAVLSLRPFRRRFDKPMTKVERAVNALKDNPSWTAKMTRELEGLTDIDRNTWSKAKGRLKWTIPIAKLAYYSGNWPRKATPKNR